MFTTPAARRQLRAVGNVALPMLGIACVVTAWWAATDIFGVQPILLPAPAQVLTAATELRDHLIKQAGVTLSETLQGFALSCAAGIALGLAIASSWMVERTLYPLLAALNAIPKPALAPLLIVWLGFDTLPKVVMAFLVSFFPVVLATATGLTTISNELSELARSLSATRWQTFTKIRFPAALPEIFIGLKLAMPLAVIGAVIGEFVGGSAGLGSVIIQSGATANTAVAFAAIVLLSIMSVTLFYILVAIERFALPWIAATTSVR